MSRILGFMRRDQGPAEPTVLRHMAATMRHSATDGPRLHVNGSSGLAFQCLRNTSTPDDHQPVAIPPGITLAWDGRLDNRDEIISLLSGELPDRVNDLSDASLVVTCYRRFGMTFAKHLNGDFAVVLYDSRERCLLLARDVIGIRPLYYWISCDLVIASSEIKGILAHPEVEATPSDDALADLLVGGNVQERRLTCFANVYRVLPGHTVMVTPQRVEELTHWDFDPYRQVRLGSVGEYAEALRELFQKAVLQRLRTPGSAAVMVSGGLDSSAILCQAETLRQAGAPVAQTVGISHVFPDGTPADEKRYLLDMEQMYQIQIRRLPFTEFRYVDDLQWVWNFESPRLPWDAEIETLKAARELGCSVILDGDYADNIVASYANLWDLARTFRFLRLKGEFRSYSQSLTDCPPMTLAKDLLRPFLRDLMPEKVMPLMRKTRWRWGRDRSGQWYTAAFRELAYHRSQQQQRIGFAGTTKHAEILYRYFHSFHVVNGFEERDKLAAEFGLEHAHPFVTRDLIAFIMSIPAEIVSWQGTYKSLFREAMRGILPESIRLRSWKADFSPLDNNAAAMAIPRFQELFQPDCCAIQLGYVNPSTVREDMSRHAAALTGQRLAPSMQITTLAALELWLRTFFQGNRRSSEYSGFRSSVYQNGSTVPK